jgi:hypothetical protein
MINIIKEERLHIKCFLIALGSFYVELRKLKTRKVNFTIKLREKNPKYKTWNNGKL